MSALAIASRSSSRPPLLHIGAALFGDLLSTLFYAAVLALTHDLRIAWAVAVAAGLGGLIWTRSRGRPLGAIQLMSFCLVLVFGGAALVTNDPRFIMFKPTLIYAAVGASMLKRGWMDRYVPPLALRHAPRLVDGFGYVWAAVMFLNGVLNLWLALSGDVRLWAAFLATAPLTLKLGLGATQYAVTRHAVVSAIRRERAAGAAAG